MVVVFYVIATNLLDSMVHTEVEKEVEKYIQSEEKRGPLNGGGGLDGRTQFTSDSDPMQFLWLSQVIASSRLQYQRFVLRVYEELAYESGPPFSPR